MWILSLAPEIYKCWGPSALPPPIPANLTLKFCHLIPETVFPWEVTRWRQQRTSFWLTFRCRWAQLQVVTLITKRIVVVSKEREREGERERERELHIFGPANKTECVYPQKLLWDRQATGPMQISWACKLNNETEILPILSKPSYTPKLFNLQVRQNFKQWHGCALISFTVLPAQVTDPQSCNSGSPALLPPPSVPPSLSFDSHLWSCQFHPRSTNENI